MTSNFYRRILDVYEEMGYPPGVVGQWAIPERDADVLVREVERQAPGAILDVGTFVGFAALLMAHYTRDDAVVHSIDPNMPLEVEFEAMGSRGESADLRVPTQEIAREATRRLGLSHKIEFHQGGFSTSNTFAMAKSVDEERIEVVGDRVCADHGPFELILIDGLHYTDAVLSDLRLAHAHLAPSGSIMLHDVIGMWGSNVRRAINQFLSEHHDLRFEHGRYEEIYDAMGRLTRVSDPSVEAITTIGDEEVRAESPNPLCETAFVNSLVYSLVRKQRPGRVAQFGDIPGELPTVLEALGASIERFPLAELDSGATLRPQPDSPLRERFDLGICLGAADSLDDGSARHLLTHVAEHCDTILLGTSPPGEARVSGSCRESVDWWEQELLQRGFVLVDGVRPDLEPIAFPHTYHPNYQARSTQLLNLHLARRNPAAGLISEDPDVLEAYLAKSRRIEDLSIQGLYSDILVRSALDKLRSTQEAYDDRTAELERVLRNYSAVKARLDEVSESYLESQAVLEDLRRVYRQALERNKSDSA